MGVYNNPADRPLPRVGRHALAALLLVGGIVGAGAATLMTAKAEPGWSRGEIALPAAALPPSSDTLMAGTTEDTLPDLLDGDVADGANPTEMVGALIPPPPTSTPGSQSPGPKRIEMDSAALSPAPLPALQAESEFGKLPAKAPDGRTAFRTYARPFRGTDLPDVSVVVGGLGINAEMTRRAIQELPPEVTLSFAAHAPDIQEDIDLARTFGHEVLLELPMESGGDDPSEPGADRRLTVDGGEANARNLDYLLSRAGGYFAVTPFGGERFLAAPDARPVLAKLEGAGLGLITDGSSTAGVLRGRAGDLGLPFRDGTMLIDATPERALIDRDLEALRAKALAGERPVGFGFAYPATIDALVDWLPTLERTELAPASAAMR